MSSAKINISQLPTADEVKSGDFFIIDDVTVTKKIDFNNIIFGLNNVTFASTISSHSTEIQTISADVIALSAQESTDYTYLVGLISTSVQSATAAFINILYPIDSIKYTATDVNPSTTIIGTTWTRIAEGLFVGGQGTVNGGDANGDVYFIRSEWALNQPHTEFYHQLTLTELPAHNHQPPDSAVLQGSEYGFLPKSNSQSSQNQTAGSLDKNQQGSEPNIFNSPVPPLTVGSGSLAVPLGVRHNNTPPVYGMYIWKRTA